MAISVNWATDQIIFIPKADTTLVQASPEVREISVETLHDTLRTLEAAEGQHWPITHTHSGEITLSGITYARFIEILPPYTVEFEVTGGAYGVSVVGGNTNLLDVKVANGTSLLGNNSAGLVNLNTVLSLLNYQGSVWLSAANGVSGTIEGVNGVPSNPVDNMADAVTLLDSLGLKSLRILDGTFTMTADLVSHEIFMGSGNILNFGGFSVSKSTITGGKCTGTQGAGKATFVETEIEGVTGLLCQARNCGLGGGPNVLAVGKSEFHLCHSDVIGAGAPTLDFSTGAGVTVGCRSYTGGLTLKNMADAGNEISLDFIAGHAIVDPGTCTAGLIQLRGNGERTGDGDGVTITDQLVKGTDTARTRKHITNRVEITGFGGTTTETVYDDDDTALETATLSTDGAEPVETSVGVQTKRTKYS